MADRAIYPVRDGNLECSQTETAEPNNLSGRVSTGLGARPL
jgi:hypothetical protein